MNSLNKVLLIGNLTRDPEIRYTAKGSAVADFSIALNRGFSNDAGERVEETTFVDIVAWNKSAELAREYFSKGRKVYVEGRLQLDTWEDKETRQPRQKMRVIAERLDFADAKPQQDRDPRSNSDSDSDDEPVPSSQAEPSQSRQ
ncbi:MAG: single-stranded DNA-binding protein, partial [Verrucomicrobia bacterium]|nr:single-stranded DNA-binding protein [Verrucomicrobiota bacterium]